MPQDDKTDKSTLSDTLVGRPMVRKERSGKPLHPSINEEQVSNLVEAFYGKVRQHPRLAMLFAGGMSMEWPEHLDVMKRFWRSMLMQTREYGGKPVPAHAKLQGLEPEDFAEWLVLFRETAKEICPPDAAELYIHRAETIARSLQMAILLKGGIAPPDAFENGVMREDFIAFVRRQDNQDDA